jgi:hypothetical protein
MNACAYAFSRSPIGVALLATILLFGAGNTRAICAETIVSVANPDEVDELTAEIQSRLRTALEAGEASRSKWTRLHWQGIECYVPADVRKTLERVKSDLHGATGDARLAALQTYVDQQLDNVGRMPPTMMITQPSVFRGRTKRVEGVRTELADSSFSDLRNFVESLLASARLAVDVTVESEPSGAQLMMQAGSNAGNRMKLATTSQLKNVWRGIYRITVDQPGYKTAALDLDLVNQGGLAILCKLAKKNETDDSRCTQTPMK